jgi:hypothetical protein
MCLGTTKCYNQERQGYLDEKKLNTGGYAALEMDETARGGRVGSTKLIMGRTISEGMTVTKLP